MYSKTLYIRPTTLTDLTVTLTRKNEVVNTWTLSDFVLGSSDGTNYYLQGTINNYVRNDILTVSSTGYQTQTIDIWRMTTDNITLTPLEFSNIETNSIKYYCKDEVARNSIANMQTTGNLVTSISSSSTDSQYPSAKCVYDEIQTTKRNIGEIIQSTIPLTDAGLHLLDGTLLQYGIYKEFIDYIADLYAENPTANYFTDETTWQNSVTQYGSCGKFVYDSTLNTVRLPKVTGIIEGTTDATALGDLVQAGLPNIEASTAMVISSRAYPPTGAFSWSANQNKQNTNEGGKYWQEGTMNYSASRSSSLYKNNFNKVQPQTIKVLYYIVVANSYKTAIQVDIDEIATGLNGKADVDLTNVNDTGKILMSEMGMPSDTYIDLTLGASGSTYTAPANGYVAFSLTSDTNGAEIWLSSISAGGVYLMCSSSHSNAANQGLDAYLQVKKNQSFEAGYLRCKSIGSRTSDRFRFIYAQGSESEAS